MVAIKTLTPSRAIYEFRKNSLRPDRTEPKASSPFAGFIFVCSNETIPDLDRMIFGLPYSHASSVCAIKRGMPLFLFNYSTRLLCGVFEAASDGGLDLDPFAWETESRSLGGTPSSRYPAQVRVQCRCPRSPLAEESFRPILDHIYGYKFKLELTAYQVQQLLKLFGVPEREFFGDKIIKWLNGSKFVPESLQSAFNSDYDRYSECSSKGTSFGDDEWTDEEIAFKERAHQFLPQSNSEQFPSGRLQHISLKVDTQQSADENHQDDSPYRAPSSMGMPPELPGSNYLKPSSPQTAWKGTTGEIPTHYLHQMIYSRDMYQMFPRPQEVDPAVYSKPVDPLQTPAMEVNDTETVPVIPALFPSPCVGYKNMIYIPVSAQPRQLMGLPLQVKGNESKKLPGGSVSTKQVLSSDKCEKGVNLTSQKMSRLQYPIYLQGLHYGQGLVPFCAARPIPDCDPNASLSSVVMPPYGQGLRYVNPQGSVAEEFEEGQASPQLHGGGFHNYVQAGPFPVLFAPSVIPRLAPNLSPIATGFKEALHFNILQFARLTRPSAETQLLVEAAIDEIRSCVRSAWPQSDVEVFGSYATGLCLYHSDVDIAVVNAPLLPSLVNMTTSQASAFLLRELGSALKTAKCIEDYNVIANASVPVLKCYYWPVVKFRDPSIQVPSIAVDITIGGIQNSSYVWNQASHGASMGKLGGQHTGGAAREYVLNKIQELPALSPLVLLMKSFLHHRGLSNVYLGGLGSYSLTLLLVYYLERVPSLHGDKFVGWMAGDLSQNFTLSADLTDNSDASETSVDSVNWSLGKYYARRAAGIVEKALALGDAGGVAYLGTLLLGFLRAFGFDQDFTRDKIVLKGMNGSPGGIFKRDNRHIAVWIDDPLRPGVNVAAGSFGMCEVQAAFREMLLALADGELLTSPLQCDDGDCQDLAAYGQLFLLSQLLMEKNDFIK